MAAKKKTTPKKAEVKEETLVVEAPAVEAPVVEAPVVEAPKAKGPVLRVYRETKPHVTRGKGIITLMTEDTQVGDQKIRGKCERLVANHANQYVLKAGAIQYDKQRKALEFFVEKGELLEVDAKTLGVPYISEEEKELAVIQKREREIKADLGMA